MGRNPYLGQMQQDEPVVESPGTSGRLTLGFWTFSRGDNPEAFRGKLQIGP